jgi:Uncharacterized alpha/beta hydrolase domain (DUF2235)
MSRNLVVCLDGTSNEPETDVTNVARLFDMVVKDDEQLVYYDPGCRHHGCPQCDHSGGQVAHADRGAGGRLRRSRQHR